LNKVTEIGLVHGMQRNIWSVQSTWLHVSKFKFCIQCGECRLFTLCKEPHWLQKAGCKTEQLEKL